MTKVGGSLAVKVVKYWLPVAFMLGAMYYASTDVFSGDNTLGVVERALAWLMPGASRRTIDKFHYALRKMAHFTEYAFLAALLFRAFRADSPLGWRLKWALYSFVLIVCWALLDEYHQSLTATRGGSVYDSMIDSAGGLFMLLVIAFYNRPGRKGAGWKNR